MTDVITRISATASDLQHRLSHSRLPHTYTLHGELTTTPRYDRQLGLALSLPTELYLPTPLAYLWPSYDHRAATTNWFFGYAQDGHDASHRYRTLIDDIATQLAIDRDHPARVLLCGRAAYIDDPFQHDVAQHSSPASRARRETPYVAFLLEAAAIDALTTLGPLTVHIVSPHQGTTVFSSSLRR